MEIFQDSMNFLFGRAGAYRAVFDGPRAREVLVDLAKFCRAHESTADANPHIAARLDGRREVWLRIQEHIQMNNDDLWKLYK